VACEKRPKELTTLIIRRAVQLDPKLAEREKIEELIKQLGG